MKSSHSERETASDLSLEGEKPFGTFSFKAFQKLGGSFVSPLVLERYISSGRMLFNSSSASLLTMTFFFIEWIWFSTTDIRFWRLETSRSLRYESGCESEDGIHC